jgi:ABC-type uncharacterized transport system ATPase subunit
MPNNNNNKSQTMTRQQMETIAYRYEYYCHNLISLAGQVKHLEETHGMNLSETQDLMWRWLEQLTIDKPNWLQ